ncbi:hypothetical protein LQF12_10330 [Ruania suaedae]|uniref:hypothetical protein n=1 Tax=Ruania suaedae TaxID=2897774 RepID=UPI001E3F3B74|nr:hypothetical protein [Ruania suaedae]UFU01913.1 hypothetical protein LQF12_10330 [Ruania suaedae]
MIKKPALTVLGVIAVLIGAVWAGQGVGLLPGSSMTGDPTWLVIGAVVLVVGVVLIVISTRGRSWRNPNGPSGQH